MVSKGVGATQVGKAMTDVSFVLVEAWDMPAFNRRLAGLNKKADAFGLPHVKVMRNDVALYERRGEWVGRDEERLAMRLVPVAEGSMPKHPVELRRLLLEYPVIKLGDWKVIGKLEQVEGGNLVFCVSKDLEDVAELRARREKTLACEHCGKVRRRSGTFVLRSLVGEGYREVGSDCLKDFTGIDPGDVLFLAKLYSLITSSDGDLAEFMGSKRVNAVSTLAYLADVAFLCKHGGFVSSSKASETGLEPTYSQAQGIESFLRDADLEQKYEAERDEHLAMGQLVREWVLSKPTTSDFDENTKLLLKQDALKLERKHLAFAAATVPMYMRSVAVNNETRHPSEHVGKKGDKLTSRVVVGRVVEMPNPFGRGVRFLVLMSDPVGNRLVWKTTVPPRNVADGSARQFEATFRVKAHGEYRQVKQTEVTHLKISQEMV